jgi:hypothetical protein
MHDHPNEKLALERKVQSLTDKLAIERLAREKAEATVGMLWACLKKLTSRWWRGSPVRRAIEAKDPDALLTALGVEES